MTITIMPEGRQRYHDNDGNLAVGCLLYTYAAGTTTPKAAYQDSAAVVPHTNPIVLDAKGEAVIYWSGAYKIDLKTIAGVQITGWPVDNVTAPLIPTDLSASVGAGLIGFLISVTYPVGSIGRWLVDLATSAGSSLIGYIQNGVGAVTRTMQSVLREEWRFTDFGVTFDGSTDDTAAINAAILAAYKAAASVASPYGETYAITIKAPMGKDCKIAGKILLPSQVVLDWNGCRLIGIDASAGSEVYDSFGQQMFETAYYDGTVLVSNEAAANETTWRVVGAGIKNAFFKNCNCPINAINLQEQSLLDGLRFENCSTLMRLKNCFYLRIGKMIPLISRTSAQAAGQYAILLHGVAAHDMQFDARIVGAAICYEVTATNSFSVEIDGSCEEGYANNSIGIRLNAAYCQSWTIHAYMEGVRKGITMINNGSFNASLITPSYFSACEYAIHAGTSSLRACTVDCNSAPDEGAGIRNLMDFSAPNNDVIFRVEEKRGDTTIGPRAFLSNVLLGAGSHAIGTSMWGDITDVTAGTNILAMCDARQINKSGIGPFPFEGGQIVTKQNQVPFAVTSVAVNTLNVQTALNYDLSNVLTFNFFGTTDTLTYQLCGTIYGATVVWDVRNPIGCVLTVNNVGGYVQLVFTNLTAAVPTINVSGMVRHI